jgi:hypothetical protein
MDLSQNLNELSGSVSLTVKKCYWLVGSSIDEITGAKIPLSKFLGGLFIFDGINSKNFRIRVFAKEISGELMSKFWLRSITIRITILSFKKDRKHCQNSN